MAPIAGSSAKSAQRLARYYAGADSDGMGLVTLDGGELDKELGQLLVEARTSSLFGVRRVVRVRNAGKALTTTLSQLSDDPSGAIVILEAGNLVPETAHCGRSRRPRAMPVHCRAIRAATRRSCG